MSLTKLSLAGKNEIIPGQGKLVTSRLGTGKRLTIFLQCMMYFIYVPMQRGQLVQWVPSIIRLKKSGKLADITASYYQCSSGLANSLFLTETLLVFFMCTCEIWCLWWRSGFGLSEPYRPSYSMVSLQNSENDFPQNAPKGGGGSETPRTLRARRVF